MIIRVWNKTEKRFEKDFAIVLEMGELIPSVEGYSSDELVISQGTGVTDRNGYEIFEGDVVKFVKSKARLRQGAEFTVRHSSFWGIREGCIKPAYNGFGVSTNYSLTEKTASCVEIIGNIYQDVN